MALRLKPGVRVLGIRGEIMFAILAIEDVYEEYQQELVITSVTDGAHMVGSLHHCGLAIDCRLPKHSVSYIVDEIRRRLGAHYDVVHEDDHIHVEYDPK